MRSSPLIRPCRIGTPWAVAEPAFTGRRTARPPSTTNTESFRTAEAGTTIAWLAALPPAAGLFPSLKDTPALLPEGKTPPGGDAAGHSKLRPAQIRRAHSCTPLNLFTLISSFFFNSDGQHTNPPSPPPPPPPRSATKNRASSPPGGGGPAVCWPRAPPPGGALPLWSAPCVGINGGGDPRRGRKRCEPCNRRAS